MRNTESNVALGSYNHETDETPYYRPPVMYPPPQDDMMDDDYEMEDKKPNKALMYALAGVIGLLTLGSVILSDD